MPDEYTVIIWKSHLGNLYIGKKYPGEEPIIGVMFSLADLPEIQAALAKIADELNSSKPPPLADK